MSALTKVPPVESLLREKPVPPAVRDEVVRQYTPMVWRFAHKLEAGAPDWSADTAEDFFQEGVVFLLEAAERFDPGRRVKFFTYAYTHVWGKLRALTHTRNGLIRVPSHHLDKTRRAQGFMKDVCRALNVLPFLEDDDGDVFQVEAPGEEEGPDLDQLAAVRWALPLLPERYRKVVELRVGLGGPPRTLQEVGGEIGVTREAVRQLEMKALARLRALAREKIRRDQGRARAAV